MKYVPVSSCYRQWAEPPLRGSSEQKLDFAVLCHPLEATSYLLVICLTYAPWEANLCRFSYNQTCLYFLQGVG